MAETRQRPIAGQSQLGPIRFEGLVTHFADQIRDGVLCPGDRLPSFTELQAQFGTAPSTINRAFVALEQQGLIIRERRRGVFVADGKKLVRQGTIGFVSSIELHHHPYYMYIQAGIREEARRYGVEVLFLHFESAVRWDRIDGIIYPAPYHHLLEVPPGKAAVAIIYEVGNCVIADDYVGIREAIDHLWELGHRRMSYLTSDAVDVTFSNYRLRAYREGLRKHGAQPADDWLYPLSDQGQLQLSYEEIGYMDMQRWLAQGWSKLGCTALLAHNDEVAVGAIRALQETGLRVPDDISVVGFDGTEIAMYHRPQLTTVKAPLREIGARGFRLLMELVERPLRGLGEKEEAGLPIKIVLPTRLQIGRSTGLVQG